LCSLLCICTEDLMLASARASAGCSCTRPVLLASSPSALLGLRGFGNTSEGHRKVFGTDVFGTAIKTPKGAEAFR
jgi:hypothetical protein